jgi:hypothetical protein
LMPNTNPCGSQFDVHACPCVMHREPGSVESIPADIRAFLRQADPRIRRYHRRYRNAYPWPDEERALGRLFERHASARFAGRSHGGEDFRLRRKSL